MAKVTYSGKDLTKYLRELSRQIHEVDEGGDEFSKAYCLARQIWNRALGYTEKRKLDDGTIEETKHAPEWQAVLLLIERLEGKAPQATSEQDERLSALEKVRDASKARAKALLDGVMGQRAPDPRKITGIPKFRPKKDEDEEDPDS